MRAAFYKQALSYCVAIPILLASLAQANAFSVTRTFSFSGPFNGSESTFSASFILPLAQTGILDPYMDYFIGITLDIQETTRPPLIGDGQTSFWDVAGSETVTDNFGDGSSVGVDDNNAPIGTRHPMSGSEFSFTSIPTYLEVDLGTDVYSLAGPISGSLTTTIYSAAGLSVTPLPASLPLFATGLGGLGLLGWRRKRKGAKLET